MMMRTVMGIAHFALLAASVFAQSVGAPTVSAPPAEANRAFEIADVHVSPHSTYLYVNGGIFCCGRYALRQATMVDLISAAYSVDASNVVGGPSWLEWDRFDVFAKIPPAAQPESVKLMLQSLLADRFKLAVHTGSKSMPAYDLTVGKDKVKMKQSDGVGDSGCQYQPPPQNLPPGTILNIVFTCRNISMETFAQDLRDWARGYLTNPVFDSTGLKGLWDFEIKWTGKEQLEKAGADGISIFDAVDKQLGLKLELQTAPRPVLIVDSVNEKPTPNPPDFEKVLPLPPPTQFEVAVIKPSKPDERGFGKVGGDQVNMQDIPLKLLIQVAWDLNENDNEALAGAPSWLGSDRFDVLAKLPSDALGSGAPNAPPIDENAWRAMLRTLLMDRFKMKVHTENRPGTSYTLIAVNPKLTKADLSSRTRCKAASGSDGRDPKITNPMINTLVSCQNVTMAQFGEALQNIADGYIFTPVLDATGIQGSWDFTLGFSSADLVRSGKSGISSMEGASDGAAPDPSGAISLFDAVKKELGLKLEKQIRPRPVFIIDHIEEKPTEN